MEDGLSVVLNKKKLSEKLKFGIPFFPVVKNKYYTLKTELCTETSFN